MATASVPQSGIPEADWSIRRARNADIPLLGPVERSAAGLFRTANLDHIADGPTLDPSLLATLIDANHLWTAVDIMDQPVGFSGGEDIDGNFHLVEISVAQNYQKKGVGKALMRKMEEELRVEGYKAMTLTTNRNLAWNGPWYKRIGFEEVKAQDIGRKYLEILEDERQHGLEPASRCVMRKIL